MGVLKLSSRTSCFLLWLFVVHSVQVCVLAVPSKALRSGGGEKVPREAAPASGGPEKMGSAIDGQDLRNAAHSDVALSGEAHALGSKGPEGREVDQIPISSQPVVISDQSHSDQEKSGNNGGEGNSSQRAQTATIAPAQQDIPSPASGPVGQQQSVGVQHPPLSSSDKVTDNGAVGTVKEPVEGNATNTGASQATSTSEVTTLPQEKTSATTASKPAGHAYLVTSKHEKFLSSIPSQGQGVDKKYSDTLPDMPKDMGGMPPASSGNIGHVREPDSGEDLEPPLPTQKQPTFVVSTSAQLGAQSVTVSMGGSRPEKPLDASGATGSMSLLPAQDDSHFFAYFLTAVVICVVGYLAFHNKRKILALILEGRHERQRRHNGHYRRLDNVDDVSAVRKGRGSF